MLTFKYNTLEINENSPIGNVTFVIDVSTGQTIVRIPINSYTKVEDGFNIYEDRFDIYFSNSGYVYSLKEKHILKITYNYLEILPSVFNLICDSNYRRNEIYFNIEDFENLIQNYFVNRPTSYYNAIPLNMLFNKPYIVKYENLGFEEPAAIILYNCPSIEDVWVRFALQKMKGFCTFQVSVQYGDSPSNLNNYDDFAYSITEPDNLLEKSLFIEVSSRIRRLIAELILAKTIKSPTLKKL